MAAAQVAFYSPAGNGKITSAQGGTWIVNAGSMAQSTVTFVEGTGSMGDKVSATTRTAYDVAAADLSFEPWNFAAGQADDGEHLVVWLYMYEGWNTLANGGFGILIADDLATDNVGAWYVGPQAGYVGGWYPYIVSPKKNFDAIVSGTWTTNGNPAQLTGVDGFGGRWNVLSTISGATDNVYIDAISVGLGYQITLGDAGSAEGKFSDFVTFEETVTNRYGFMRSVSGIPFMRCKVIIGATSGAANTEFIDSGFTVVWEKVVLSDGTSSAVDAGFYELRASKGTGTTDITLSEGVLKAVSPHTVVINLSAATSATLSGVNVDRGDTITLGTTTTWNDSTLTNCGQITAAGANFNRNSVSGYTGAADTAALVWNVATETDGLLDGVSITKGANAHHAIQFTTYHTTAFTINDAAFSGFNASDGQQDSTLYFSDTGTDRAWTINLVGCSGNISYKKVRAGDTVTLVVDPVSLSVHVQDIDTAAAIVGARVWAKVTSGASGWPYQESVTIANSGTTATVTHTGHGLASNDFVDIDGASHWQNNGTFQITKTGDNTYTYTMLSAPGSNPTGTITSTFVVLAGTTSGTGDISASRSYVSDQPITGRVRSASAAPYYKTAPITGTISSTAGLALVVQMIKDQ